MTGRRLHDIAPWLASVTVFLGILLFMLAGLYTFRQSEKVDRALCRNTVENRDAVRATWNAAREIMLRNADDPRRIDLFFDAVLKPIPALKCVDNQPVPKEG